MFDIRMIEKHYAKQRRNRALILSLAAHVIAVIVIAIWLLKPLVEQMEDSFVVEFVPPPQRIHRPKKIVREVKPHHTTAEAFAPSTAAKRLPASVGSGSLPRINQTSKLEAPPLSTVAELAPSPESVLAAGRDTAKVARGSDPGRGAATERGQGVERGGGVRAGAGLGNAAQSGSAGQDAFGEGIPDTIGTYEDEIGDELGSVIDEEDGVVRGHIRLIRLKHEMADWWQDPTAIPSLIKWLREHTPSITADMKYAGGALPLTDARIMDAPLVLMTGHDQAMSAAYHRIAERNSKASGFSEAERAALRKYILDHNGMLFFDYCGTGGNEQSFASLVANELRIIFPEYPLTRIESTTKARHEIFQAYFNLKQAPIGGSYFWDTGYKGGNEKYGHRRLQGIEVPGKFGKKRLGVVFCQLDYLCSMETAEVDSRAPLASRRSSDVYRFMTNMFVYQMRQRADNK